MSSPEQSAARSREELDAQALREHIAANPTTPSGPPPNPEIAYSEDEPRTVTFHNKDGSVKAVVTTRFRHVRKTYRLPSKSIHSKPVPKDARMTRFHDTNSNFHLRNGLMFNREGDEIVIEPTSDGQIRVPVNEWASAVAWTSTRGEASETYQETLALLGSYENDA